MQPEFPSKHHLQICNDPKSLTNHHSRHVSSVLSIVLDDLDRLTTLHPEMGATTSIIAITQLCDKIVKYANGVSTGHSNVKSARREVYVTRHIFASTFH